MKVKFHDDGKWADPDVNKPQIEVKAGEVRDISPEFAQVVIDAGKGELIENGKQKEEPKKKPGRPPKVDKERADQT